MGEVTKRTHKHTSADIKETTATSKSKTRVKGMSPTTNFQKLCQHQRLYLIAANENRSFLNSVSYYFS